MPQSVNAYGTQINADHLVFDMLVGALILTSNDRPHGLAPAAVWGILWNLLPILVDFAVNLYQIRVAPVDQTRAAPVDQARAALVGIPSRQDSVPSRLAGPGGLRSRQGKENQAPDLLAVHQAPGLLGEHQAPLLLGKRRRSEYNHGESDSKRLRKFR